MFTAERCRRVLLAALVTIACSQNSFAHPVAQGSLNVTLFPDRVRVEAALSAEEVLVAASGKQAVPSFAAAVNGHGSYLLDHLQLVVDGRRLEGRVMESSLRGQPMYDLEYALPSSAVRELTLSQDSLRELSFAPGVSWEASYMVRVAHADRPALEGLLLTHAEPLQVSCERTTCVSGATGGTTSTVLAFVRHGFRHILTGYDHVLFVIALALAVVSFRDLVKVIAAFSLAHTITLTLAVLGMVRLSSGIVEPMIAASIVLVALLNVIWPRDHQVTSRMAMLVAFSFGLFHGLGFAGGLVEAMQGMRSTAVAVAIAAFSVGVELGHQAVVLPVFAALYAMRRFSRHEYDRVRIARRYGSAAISIAGVAYLAAALV